MDALIDKSDRCAKLAEELGLEEDASTYRKGNRLYKELKDDLARIGEKVWAKETSRQTTQAK